ncbi:GNAT family N-acetyltransferase [Fulvimarina endophytica]|uniref:GNAT family N-acetyltransferase n=1 Tax=Fulvimarina endophytica TaxID=2293836 RepID=A0A371X0A5_9HYPH|nr:GNAT family N-acetyltransferase [Fulvimarina endophytica]RFC62677.1 GNAT family N-acetyltransferase [Fulvimarina endophytica]
MTARLVSIPHRGAKADNGLEIGLRPTPLVEVNAAGSGSGRRLSIYEPRDAFGLISELTHLSERAIERNIFYDPRFLVPAMPRLEDRRVRLLVMRDEAANHSRLRLLLPYSLERTGRFSRRSVMRVWSHPFGPVGSLPIDGDNPVGTVRSLVRTIAEGVLDLPPILVLPDIRAHGGMARTLSQAASELSLPLKMINEFERAALSCQSPADAALTGKRRRELERGRRLLESQGQLRLDIARKPDAFRTALEDFFILEASGWKGRARSALISDRFRSAFAREALNDLAAHDRARIFTLRLDGEAIASLVLLVDQGEAYTWKSAYNETYAKASPGQQIMAAVTRILVADPTIGRADSCAVPDHFVMNRFWHDRIAIGTMVLGMKPGLEGEVDAVARSLENSKRSANRVRLMREAVRAALGR